ncbi:MAG: hypothetical protein ABI678_02390 [Kofleriaceae bacterium]
MILFASFLAITGCKKDDGDDQETPDGGGSGSNNNGDAAFTIQSTDVTMAPGTEKTYCFWFHTPNTTPIAVNKWVSDMTPGSHHMIFFAGGPEHADGIDPANTCGNGTGAGQNQPNWTFASQTAHLEENLPADDGTGKPLAQVIQPNTVGAFQMHYLNSTDNPLTIHVSLSAYKLDDAVAYTRTDAYVTYQTQINIGIGATGVSVPGSCDAPAGAKFWTLSTHAHKQAVDMKISDGTSMLFDSQDWEHPGTKDWTASPFYSFAGKINWTCTYDNTGDNKNSTISQGTSAATDEMCMATGYYFPATKAQFCVAQGSNSCFCF